MTKASRTQTHTQTDRLWTDALRGQRITARVGGLPELDGRAVGETVAA